VFALFNLNLIVFLLLLVLLIRNLVKLWFERRQQLIGAKFKTKLVLSFLALSLAPAVLIFIIASNFINKSIEGWFKPQVERPLGLGGQAVTTVRELSSGDLIEAIVPVVSRDPNRRVVGAVVVGTHVTERLEAKIRGIEQSFQEYKQLKLVKNPVKGIYILLFLLMTLIVVFSFVWFGF